MLNSKFNINRTEWLNLVFENRNQEYGAFILRRNSGNYLAQALLFATLFFSCAIVLSAIISYKKEIINFVPNIAETKKDFVLHNVLLSTKPIKPLKSKPALTQPKSSNTNLINTEILPPKVVIDIFGTNKLPTIELVNTGAISSQIIDQSAPTLGANTEGLGIKGGTSSAATSAIELLNANSVEIIPEFPGGIAGWNKYLAKNLRYPPIALENGTSGRVTLSFVVETNGEITNLKVLGSIGDGCEEEALRVLKKSPFWKPGFQNGRAVRVSYIMPIFFQMNSI